MIGIFPLEDAGIISNDGIIEEVTTTASRIPRAPHPVDWSGAALAIGFGLLLGAALVAISKN